MMKAKYILFVLPLIATLAFGAVTYDGIGGQGGMLFEAGGSARSLAMGMANTGLADQSEAVLYNPAGLGQIHTAKLGLLGGSLYAGAVQSVLAFNMPWASFGTFGITYAGAFGSLEQPVDENGQPIQVSGLMNNSAVLISYAKKFGAFSAGVTPKLMFSQLSEYQALGFDADIGVMFFPLSFAAAKVQVDPTKTAIPYDMVSIGLTVKNLLGAKMRFLDDTLEPSNPRIVRAGLGGRFLDNRLNLDVDISYMLNDEGVFSWYGGLEVYPVKMFALRFGANDRYFTGGLGISTELARNFSMDIDYAVMLNYGSELLLQPVHKLSLNLGLKSVAGIWLEAKPATLNSPADYAEIAVHGAPQFKGRHKRWVFEIKDAGGNIVYRQSRDVFGEMDELPAKFTWNGVNNIRGGQVDNGTYYYKLTIFDKLGDQIIYEGQLVKVNWRGARR